MFTAGLILSSQLDANSNIMEKDRNNRVVGMVSALAVMRCGQVKVDSRIAVLSSIGVAEVRQHEPGQQAGRGFERRHYPSI